MRSTIKINDKKQKIKMSEQETNGNGTPIERDDGEGRKGVLGPTDAADIPEFGQINGDEHAEPLQDGQGSAGTVETVQPCVLPDGTIFFTDFSEEPNSGFMKQFGNLQKIEVPESPFMKQIRAYAQNVTAGKTKEEAEKTLVGIIEEGLKIKDQADDRTLKNIGALLTVLATEYSPSYQSSMVIEEKWTKFAKDSKMPYAFAFLANAKFAEGLLLEGRYAFYKAQNVDINSVNCGPYGLHEAKDARIKHLFPNDNFGFKSEDIVIYEVQMAGKCFGMFSKGMKVYKIDSVGDDFGKGSKGMHIKKLEKAIGSVGSSSEDMMIEELGEARKIENTNNMAIKNANRISYIPYPNEGLVVCNLTVTDVSTNVSSSVGNNYVIGRGSSLRYTSYPTEQAAKKKLQETFMRFESRPFLYELSKIEGE